MSRFPNRPGWRSPEPCSRLIVYRLDLRGSTGFWIGGSGGNSGWENRGPEIYVTRNPVLTRSIEDGPPQGARQIFEKSPARPPPAQPDGIPWERGRPARILFLPTRPPPPAPGRPHPDPLNEVFRRGASDYPEMPLLANLAIDAAGSQQQSPLGGRPASVRFCRQRPCRRAPHQPSGRGAMAPFPVDRSRRDKRSCARPCAGGTPALPGSRHPMTSDLTFCMMC